MPLVYYQGVTADPDGNLYFDGIFSGLYRTDAKLRETARNDDVIPASVRANPGYNHIGDISWDAAEGGRLLLPLDCFHPGEKDPNTCGTGAIGVADPRTLQWRYSVTLDPADITKATWSEVSPDGRLLWTSAGATLLAYRTADISPAHAGPGAPPIRPVRRISSAVPPSGITGAAFYNGRLFVAGSNRTHEGPFQVWSINVEAGTRLLEIERRIVGESEGLVVSPTLGGFLHWQILPFNPEGKQPTYGAGHATLLHFAAVGACANAVTATAGVGLLRGSKYGDKLNGLAADETIEGGDGDDCLFGGLGDDTLRGGPGDDELVGDRGDDRLLGGAGNDTLDARDGQADLVDCGPGVDSANVDAVDDVVACENVRRSTP
jgi:hypothetical protein